MSWLRAIAAIAVGYAIMLAAVFLLFGLVPFGPDERPGAGFMALAVGYGFVFAVLAGFVAVAIGGGERPMSHAWSLAALVLLLGVLSAWRGDPAVPAWYQAGNVAAGVFGVVLGGFAHLRLRPPAPGTGRGS